MEEIFFTGNALPNQDQAFHEFLRTYPLYLDTLVVDHIREQEYSHLNERSQVCLDYAGVGLFSHSQRASNAPSSALGLAYISANVATHALYTAEETEMMVRRRVLRYMNLDENEYAIVFTANTLSAFKLLGESYPFHISPKLLLGYDHQCDSRDALSECAKSKGATVMNANLMWPSLKLDGADVKKKLHAKRKGGGLALKSKGWVFHGGPLRRVMPDGGGIPGDFSPNHQFPIGTQGLMAYPVISRGSGAKNSLQWIREAAQNGWHVLLDVSGLGAKAMDSLGLNLFHPDFIVGSFYKVFGFDPTGFGCLVIKKSVIRSLGDSSRARAIGMVRIMSTAGPSSSHSPADSFSSAGASKDSTMMYSSSSSDVFSSAPSMELKHLYPGAPSGPRRPDEDQTRIAQFDDQGFSTTGAAPRRPEKSSKAGLPKGPAPRAPEIEEVLPPVTGKWKEDDIAKESWVRSQASPSSSLEQPLRRNTKTGQPRSGSGRSDGSLRASTTQQNGEIVELPQSSRRHGRFYSEEQPRGGEGMRALPGRAEAATRSPEGVAPRFGKPKAPMTGLRYLQIPHRPWEQGISADEENILSRGFGKKSPLMLTLPRGFDSPGGRSPPSSKHEARQEVLVGSLPDTPSSVSAPCSPRYPRLPGGRGDGVWCNPNLAGDPADAIVCHGLDHADRAGLTRINFRLRALVNWLISSLRKLRHPTRGHPYVALVYGPLCQVDRSSTFAFNIAGSDGQLLDPVLVQRLADRNNISLGTSTIEGSFTSEVDEKGERAEKEGGKPEPKPEKGKRSREGKAAAPAAVGVSKPAGAGGGGGGSPRCIDLARQKWSSSKSEALHTGKFSALCATLGFVSSFSDVYRLWEFAALFLDSEFVNRELFHYRALNQQTILM